jgi:hypothetical protein
MDLTCVFGERKRLPTVRRVPLPVTLKASSAYTVENHSVDPQVRLRPDQIACLSEGKHFRRRCGKNRKAAAEIFKVSGIVQVAEVAV